MSVRLPNGTIIIERTEPDKCELCGKVAELRPYGPRGESICVDCGMKDEKGTERRMNRVLFGIETQ